MIATALVVIRLKSGGRRLVKVLMSGVVSVIRAVCVLVGAMRRELTPVGVTACAARAAHRPVSVKTGLYQAHGHIAGVRLFLDGSNTVTLRVYCCVTTSVRNGLLTKEGGSRAISALNLGAF